MCVFFSFIHGGKGDKDEKKKVTIRLPEHQFFSNRERLIELLTKQAEWESNKKHKGGAASSTAMNEETGTTKDSADKMQEEDAEKELAKNKGLTAAEREEKEELLETGFMWTKDEFLQFVKACEKYGRKDFRRISDVL